MRKGVIEMTRAKSKQNPPKRSRAPRALALLLLAGAGLGASPVRANEVSRGESVGCTGSECIDTFEVKCAQASALLCIDVEGNETDPTTFTFTALGTSPAQMYARAEHGHLWIDETKGFCFLRPGGEGSMKALIAVGAYEQSANGSGPRSYRLHAECMRNFDQGFATRKTTVTRRQNQ
jgi:hypothetical protein